MIQKVHRGQKLTTSLVNGIIEQANGQQIPTTGQFTNTEKGTLYIEENNIVYDFQPDIKDKFLQCKIDDVPKLTARPFDYEKDENDNVILEQQILINLGSTKEDALELIKVNGKHVKDIILIGSEEVLDTTLTNEMLKPIDITENKALLFNDGYVNTTISYSPDAPEQAVEIYGEVYEVRRENNDDGNGEEATAEGDFYYVIDDGREDYKDRVKLAIQKAEGISEDGTGNESTEGQGGSGSITHVKRVERKRIMVCTPTSSTDDTNTINAYIQSVIGSQDIVVLDDLITDSEASEKGYTDASNRPIDEYSIDHLVAIEETTDEDGNSVKDYHDYFSLHNFYKGNATKLTSVAEYEEYDFLVRKDVDGSQVLQYVEISPLMLCGDVETTDYYKSICVKEDGSGTPYYQLYNWTEQSEETKKIGLEETKDYNVLVRHGGTGGDLILEYVELSGLSSTISTDTEYLQSQKSIEKINDGNGDYLQLYNFVNGVATSTEESTLPTYDVLVRKDSELQYINIDIDFSKYVKRSELTGDIVVPAIETDTDAIQTQCSIEKLTTSGGTEYLQLYNFDDDTTIDVDDQTIKDYDILVREGTILKYVKLDISSMTSSEVSNIVETIIEEKDLSVKVDNKSVNYNDSDELQVYNFANNQSMATNLATVLEGDSASVGELLIRNNGIVDYMPIGTLSNNMTSSEVSNIVETIIEEKDLSVKVDNKSVNYNGNDELQVYNFADNQSMATNLADVLEGDSSSPGEILVRSNGVVDYMPIGTLSNNMTSSEVSNIVETIIEEKGLSAKVDNKSVNYNDADELQVYNFANNQSIATNLADVLEGDSTSPGEILVRSNGVVEYMPIGTLSTSTGSDGCYWEQGGCYISNRGSSIGNSAGESIINLDDKHMYGTWTIFYMQGCELTCGTGYIGNINCDTVVMPQHNITIGGCAAATIGNVQIDGADSGKLTLKGGCSELILGCTSLDEPELQRLLALEDGSTIETDADYTTTQQSIQKINDGSEPYLQLYQFDGDSTGNIWTDLTDTDGSEYLIDEQYDFLVRVANSDGGYTLEYRKVLVDLPMIPDYSTEIDDINDQLNTLNNSVGSLNNSVGCLQETVGCLNERVTILEEQQPGDGCYWVQGGCNSTNYGANIGDSNQVPVIDLDSKTLLGCDWHVQNNMTVPDVLYTSFVSNIDSTVGGSINLTNKSLVGSTPDDPWTIFYMQGCELTCGTVYSNSVDTGYIGMSQHNISIGGCAAAQIGAVSINGSTESPSIKIGSTTLTETQLQQLLALVS